MAALPSECCLSLRRSQRPLSSVSPRFPVPVAQCPHVSQSLLAAQPPVRPAVLLACPGSPTGGINCAYAWTCTMWVILAETN